MQNSSTRRLSSVQGKKERGEKIGHCFFLPVNVQGMERGSSGSCNYSPVDLEMLFFFFIAATLVWLMAKLSLLLLAPALWIAQGRKKWSIALGCLWERDVSTATTTTLCFLRSTGKIPVPALCWGPCFVGSSFVKSHERLGLECRSKNWVLPKTCF